MELLAAAEAAESGAEDTKKAVEAGTKATKAARAATRADESKEKKKEAAPPPKAPPAPAPAPAPAAKVKAASTPATEVEPVAPIAASSPEASEDEAKLRYEKAQDVLRLQNALDRKKALSASATDMSEEAAALGDITRKQKVLASELAELRTLRGPISDKGLWTPPIPGEAGAPTPREYLGPYMTEKRWESIARQLGPLPPEAALKLAKKEDLALKETVAELQQELEDLRAYYRSKESLPIMSPKFEGPYTTVSTKREEEREEAKNLVGKKAKELEMARATRNQLKRIIGGLKEQQKREKQREAAVMAGGS